MISKLDIKTRLQKIIIRDRNKNYTNLTMKDNSDIKDMIQELESEETKEFFNYRGIEYSRKNFFAFNDNLIAHNRNEFPHKVIFVAGALSLFFKDSNFSISL
jgi:hypothetical protein